MTGELLQLGEIIWRPVAWPVHIFAGAGVVAALAVFAYVRTLAVRPVASLILLGMRLALVASLAVLLLGPSAVPPATPDTVRPKVTVLLDTSGSMLTDDCGPRTRIRFALERWLSPAQLERWSRDMDVQFMAFDDRLMPMPASSLSRSDEQVAAGRSTRLVESVRQAIANRPAGATGGAVLLISDGRDSQAASIQPVVSLARSRGVPVHTVTVGAQSLQRDLALTALPAQEVMLAGEPGQIAVTVYQSGLDDAVVTVRMRSGDTVTQQPVRFEGQRAATVKLPIKQDQPGFYEYQVWVDPVESEAEAGNNSQVVFTQVSPQRIRVLLLEGQPHWDTKFIAQALRKDERVEVLQVTQTSSDRSETLVARGESSRSLPATAAEWARYDLVILGGNVQSLLTGESAQALASYVEQGGALVLARGRPYDTGDARGRAVGEALAAVEPVSWGESVQPGGAVVLSPAGRAGALFASLPAAGGVDAVLARLPVLPSVHEVRSVKPAAVVLARAGDSSVGPDAAAPAFVTMSVGRGRVMAVAAKGLWRWSLLPREQQGFAGFYDLFWSNLSRWMALGGEFEPGQLVSLRLAGSSAVVERELAIDVIARVLPPAGLSPTLTLIDPTGQASVLSLRRVAGSPTHLRADFVPTLTGVHRVRLDTPGLTPATQERRFNAFSLDTERLQTSADPMLMKMLAEQTGGVVFAPDEAALVPDKLRRAALAGQAPTEPRYIWDRFLFLTMLLTWAGVEWLVRRKAGML